MSWPESAAFVVVVLVGLYLVSLGAASLLMPPTATRFLLGFASSRTAHFIEMTLRGVAGAAFAIYAPHMSQPGAFRLFGWVLVGTTACLALLLWRWHHRFAQQAVPLFTRYIAAVGTVSLVLGLCVLGSVAGGAGQQ